MFSPRLPHLSSAPAPASRTCAPASGELAGTCRGAARSRAPAGARRPESRGCRLGCRGSAAGAGRSLQAHGHRAPQRNPDSAITFYCWWLRRAEVLQSQGKAFISAGTWGGTPVPSQWLKSYRHYSGTLPVGCRGGFFVNSHGFFCYSYKDSVFIRCCDLRYTNPLKKHK